MRVNFLIAGTQKGGTTAMAQFLSAHPQICFAPTKEVHFFDYDHEYDRGECHYHSFFEHYQGQPLVGEATPIYMYFPWIAPRIAQYNPQMKLILLLRNPIDRAYSQYQMEVRRGWEHLPFGVAIRIEPWRLRLAQTYNHERSALRVHSYCDRGFYSQQIAHLWQHFPRQNLLILLQEELENHHTATLHRVYDFLEVDPPPVLPIPRRVLSGSYPPLAALNKKYLSKLFTPEIERLENLLQRDLTAWKS